MTKSDGSFVTETDHAVEEIFTREFELAFPGVPVLGEERVAVAQAQGVNDAMEHYATFMTTAEQIVMDPIDGTKNFVEGRSEFCIAAALTRRSGTGIWPQAGLVAVPMAGVMYWCDERDVYREEISSGSATKVTRVASSEARFSVNSRDRAWLRENNYRTLAPWVSSGSSVHDFLGTALGELRGSLVSWQRLWDLMAPLAIAERLGCELRDFETGEIVSSVSPKDLSPEFSKRPWGFIRRMVIVPRGGEIKALISR